MLNLLFDVERFFSVWLGEKACANAVFCSVSLKLKYVYVYCCAAKKIKLSSASSVLFRWSTLTRMHEPSSLNSFFFCVDIAVSQIYLLHQLKMSSVYVVQSFRRVSLKVASDCVLYEMLIGYCKSLMLYSAVVMAVE